MFLSKATNIDYSFSVHAQDLFCSYNFSKIKNETASNIFAITEFNKNYLIEKEKTPKEKIKIKRINYQHIDLRKIKSKKLPYDYIFTASRIEEMKGLNYSLEAFAKLINEGRKNLKYLIAGRSISSDYHDSLLKIISKLDISDKVVMLGMISNTEVQSYIKGSIFTALTSVQMPDGDMEGLPTFIIESMNLGKPAVSTDFSGTPEIIIDNKTGLLTKEKDQRDIDLKFKKMADIFYDDKDTYAKMSKYCKEIRSKMYDNKKNAKILVDCVKESKNKT